MMKPNHQKSGFWNGGLAIFHAELAKEEASRLAPLKAELKATSDPARKAALKEQIAAVKAEFQAKRENAEYSLF